MLVASNKRYLDNVLLATIGLLVCCLPSISLYPNTLQDMVHAVKGGFIFWLPVIKNIEFRGIREN